MSSIIWPEGEKSSFEVHRVWLIFYAQSSQPWRTYQGELEVIKSQINVQAEQFITPQVDVSFTVMVHVTKLYVWRRSGRSEVEWTRKAEIRQNSWLQTKHAKLDSDIFLENKERTFALQLGSPHKGHSFLRPRYLHRGKCTWCKEHSDTKP